MRPCVGAAVDAAVCVRAGAGDLLGSGICCDAAVLLLLRRRPAAVLLLQVAFHWRSALRHEPGLPHAFHAAPNAMAPDELSAIYITFGSPFCAGPSVSIRMYGGHTTRVRLQVFCTPRQVRRRMRVPGTAAAACGRYATTMDRSESRSDQAYSPEKLR